jgi:hypothetical protein
MPTRSGGGKCRDGIVGVGILRGASADAALECAHTTALCGQAPLSEPAHACAENVALKLSTMAVGPVVVKSRGPKGATGWPRAGVHPGDARRGHIAEEKTGGELSEQTRSWS